MKDFQLRNDTKLLFRNDPTGELAALTAGKKTLFVYGGGSVKRNGCYDEVKKAVESAGGIFYELADASRELEVVERGIRLVKENGIELVIGAGGANIMDCAKLIAFGTYHADDLWAYVKAEKNPYGLKKLPLILMPTYPSSGSEYGLGVVSADSRTGDFGTAYGIAAVKKLKENLEDSDARGVILYGASISTSGRLGLGKEENYAYDIYELEFIPEVLFGTTYRKSLTTLFPRFLKAMANYHDSDIRRYFKDAFGYEGSVGESADKMIALFSELGVDMYFDGEVSSEKIKEIDIATLLSPDEITGIMKECLRQKQQTDDIQRNPAMQEAYQMGKSIC